MKAIKTVILFLLLAGRAGAQMDAVGPWLAGLTLPSGVYTELGKFEGLSPEYVAGFPALMKQRMTAEMQRSLQRVLQRGCSTFANVTFFSSLTAAALDPKVKEFESHMARVESVSCLPDLSVDKLVGTYLSTEYQLSAFDFILASKKEGNRFCQANKMPFVGRSEICFTTTTFKVEGATFIHSVNEFNSARSEAPIYFREMVTAFIRTPQGVVFYSLAYGRTAPLNGLIRLGIRAMIESSQQKATEVLVRMAQAH